MRRVDSYQTRKKGVVGGEKTKDNSGGGDKGWSEGAWPSEEATALRSIGLVTEDKFPRAYIFGMFSIAVALGDCLE